jgi:hypothetical protein
VGSGTREGVNQHRVHTGPRSAEGQDLGVSTRSTAGEDKHRVMTGDIVGTESREGVKSAPGTHRGKVSRGSRHGISIRSSPGKGKQRVKTWDQHQVLTGQRQAEGKALRVSTGSTPGKGKPMVILGSGSREGVKSAPGTHRAKVSRGSSPESQYRVHTGQR